MKQKEIKGRKSWRKKGGSFWFLRVAAERGERKKTALVAGFFTGSLGVLALGLHSL